ncbi:MAG: type II secretion system protein [Pseudomonadota bacterium]
MRQVSKTASREGERGSSYVELVVVAIIISILTGSLLQRLFNYQREAELAGVQIIVATLQGALVVKKGSLMARGKASEIATLVDQNPMNFLTLKPHNYLGDYFSPDADELPAGNWFFERNTKTLVYLLNNGKSFPGGIPKPLKFKVKFSHSPQDLAESPSEPGVTNVSLVQVDR